MADSTPSRFYDFCFARYVQNGGCNPYMKILQWNVDTLDKETPPTMDSTSSLDLGVGIFKANRHCESFTINLPEGLKLKGDVKIEVRPPALRTLPFVHSEFGSVLVRSDARLIPFLPGVRQGSHPQGRENVCLLVQRWIYRCLHCFTHSSSLHTSALPARTLHASIVAQRLIAVAADIGT